MAKVDERSGQFDFKKDDIISFAGDEYTIVENHGNSGSVRPAGEEGRIDPFYWRFQGEDCKLVRRCSQ